MNTYYQTAAVLVFLLGVVHSLVGEQYYLRKLFRRELPFYVGSEAFVNHTTRISWHLSTIAWFGLAYILNTIAGDAENPFSTTIAYTVAAIFFASAILAAAASKGRHLNWIAYLLISLTTWLGVYFS